MSTRSLFEPVADQGALNSHFFEGRLLTGRDLRDQREANREHDRYLGRALGAGIIDGLEVELDGTHDGSDGNPPIVAVKKGLAVNRKGDVIGLPKDDIKLALSRSIDQPDVAPADFYPCAGPPNHQHIPNGVGVYLIVMSPAAAYKERAPKSGLGDNGVVTGCGSRYIQEGVQFRLVELNVTELDGLSEATRELLEDDLLSQNNPVGKTEISRLSRLRNVLAHLCFGTEALFEYAVDPSAIINGDYSYLKYTAVDELRALEALDDCDIPLALCYWTLEGVAFVDMWSVRRSAWRRDEHRRQTPSLIQAHIVDAEAVRFQFQDQLRFIQAGAAVSSAVEALDYFLYLPPVGYVPVQSDVSSEGFLSETFFNGITAREPAFIEGARLVPVMQLAMTYWPIEPANEELIWLYRVRQNRQAIETEGDSVPQDYIIFASGHSPYAGNARFNVAKWDYSNYGFI